MDGLAGACADGTSVQQSGLLAPVALFVHARPDHLKQTLRALASNTLASKTDLFVFADGPRSDAEKLLTDEVRALVRTIAGFRSVHVAERSENYGLARNILVGVSEVVAHYGRVIVVEDDIVTERRFLEFMIAALDHYRDEPKVWHVNGWTYPIDTQVDDRAFFTSVMECWGWATWRDRWQHYERNPERFLGKWDKSAINRFNIGGGYDNWGDIKRNARGSMRTWAVFWYAIIFEHGGLCLSPPYSFTTNVGIDGSGSNSGTRDIFATSREREIDLPAWPAALTEDMRAWRLIRDFLLSRRPWIGRRAASQVKWYLKALAAGARTRGRAADDSR